MYHTLSVVNDALLNDIRAHYLNPDSMPYPDEEDNPLIVELTRFAETCGINDPLTKIYITTTPLDHFPLLMFLFVISQMPKFSYNKQLGTPLTHLAT